MNNCTKFAPLGMKFSEISPRPLILLCFVIVTVPSYFAKLLRKTPTYRVENIDTNLPWQTTEGVTLLEKLIRIEKVNAHTLPKPAKVSQIVL